MADLAQTIAEDLAAYYEMVREQVHHWAGNLTAEQFWRKPYPYGNSVGHLILHLTGNLSYYIGAQIAENGYIRHRDLEFSDSGKPKGELLKGFDEAIAIAVRAFAAQSSRDWSAPFHAEFADGSTRFAQVLACAGHAHHHVGQIIYLQRELLRVRH